MIDDSLLEYVRRNLPYTPISLTDFAAQTGIPKSRLCFILVILKRQGKAKRVQKRVELARGYRVTRNMWVKT